MLARPAFRNRVGDTGSDSAEGGDDSDEGGELNFSITAARPPLVAIQGPKDIAKTELNRR